MKPALAVAHELEPHPEGGWYRRLWTSSTMVTLEDGRRRPTASAVLFLLAEGEASAWHRVRSEELWIARVGEVRVELGGTGPEPVEGEATLLGSPDQLLVPAGVWQRTLPATQEVLVTCVVSPGFDFADFELYGG